MIRKKWLILGLILAVGLIGLGMVRWTPAGLLANLAGFRQQGLIKEFFEANNRDNPQLPIEWPEVVTLNTPTPQSTRLNNGLSSLFSNETENGASLTTPTPNPIQPLSSIEIAIYFLAEPRIFYEDEIFTNRLERRGGEDKPITYFIEYDEVGLNQYLNYWFGFWAESDGQIRNIRFDLKPAGLIVYADVDLWLRQQRVGIVFVLDSSGRQFAFKGVDIGGELFTQPPTGALANYIHYLESQGNLALSDLRFLDPAGTLTIHQIYLDEDFVQIIAK